MYSDPNRVDDKKKRKDNEDTPTELTSQLMAKIAKTYVEEENLRYRRELWAKIQAEKEAAEKAE